MNFLRKIYYRMQYNYDLSFLNSENKKRFYEYKKLNKRAKSEGWDHFSRIQEAESKPVNIKINDVVVYEHPLTKNVCVTYFSARFIQELMDGGVHPDVKAFDEMLLLVVLKNGKRLLSKGKDIASLRPLIKREYIIDNTLSHTSTTRKMTYEEAFEYAIRKDILIEPSPTRYVVMDKSELPSSRKYRNNWKLIGNKIIET
jgi:hypothetical protein